MRKYQRTHEWISFTLDLRPAPPSLWLLLGEATSKCEHICGVPLQPGVAQQLHQVFLAKGVLATTAIEGNTLTEEEVMQHLQGSLKLPPSKEYLKNEIENILRACNDIGDAVLSGRSSDLTVEEINHYNLQVLDGLKLEDGVTPGVVRRHSVGVGRYLGAPAEDCEFLLEKLCAWLNHGFQGSVENRVAVGILKAVVSHLYLAWIHPFGDGNGRTARLVEFAILLSAGVPKPAAHLLSDHYNRTRAEYYRQLDYAHKSGGNVIPFVEYAVAGFVEGLREQIEYIQTQQITVHWINYVHERFKDRDTPTGRRRRRLAIDLTRPDPVPMGEIRRVSPRIAEAYASKTDKTVKRDLNALQEMGLVKKEEHGFRARPEVMHAFLPDARNKPEV